MLGLRHALDPDHLIAVSTLVAGAAETAIGVIIVLLAARLLLRWRRGVFHVHAHEHDGERHVHVHAHREAAGHAHEHVRPRTPLQAFLIGVTHGVGGSAGVAVLLLASVSGRLWAAVALLVFAIGTAVSMGALSAGFGWLLGRRPLRQRFRLAVVPLGLAGLAFGGFYAFGAWLPALAVV